MYLVTLTLRKNFSDKKAKAEIKNILQKIAEQKPNVLTAVKTKLEITHHPYYYYQILTNAQIDNEIFAKWYGRVQKHEATSYEEAMKYFKRKKNTTFLL